MVRGFVAPGETLDAYRYTPADPQIEGQMDLLSYWYADARYAVINLIFSEPGDSARSLADAIRLRKKGDE